MCEGFVKGFFRGIFCSSNAKGNLFQTYASLSYNKYMRLSEICYAVVKLFNKWNKAIY